MGTGYVHYTCGDGEAVNRHLVNYADRLEYLIQERVEEVQFVRFEKRPPGPPWPRGRAFGSELELRWRELEPGAFDILVLTEAEQKEPDWERFETHEAYRQESLRQYLWGTHREELGGWVEAQLPRPLEYPIGSVKSFAFVRVIEYSRGGAVQFTRFCALDGEDRDGR